MGGRETKIILAWLVQGKKDPTVSREVEDLCSYAIKKQRGVMGVFFVPKPPLWALNAELVLYGIRLLA